MPNVSEALLSVNVARAILDLSPVSQLPAGHRSALRFSPISRAIEGRLTLLGSAVLCDNGQLAERLAAAWNTTRLDERQVELPAELQSFLNAFKAGMFPELETNLCTVSGCERTATATLGDAPMCDHCFEEWETVGPLLVDARHSPSASLDQPAPTGATGLFLAITRFFRLATSKITFGGFGKTKKNPPMCDKPGPSGGNAPA